MADAGGGEEKEERTEEATADGPEADVMRTPPMQDKALIDALNHASSLELYQLAALVERLMTDPRRIVAIRKDLHLGQTVRFYEARSDRCCRAASSTCVTPA